MPTYVYRRADGTTFEIEQRITDDALTTCPTTSQPVMRVISGGVGLIFKGSGFYQTDYVRNNGSADNGKPAADAKAEKSPAESKESAKAATTESKSE